MLQAAPFLFGIAGVIVSVYALSQQLTSIAFCFVVLGLVGLVLSTSVGSMAVRIFSLVYGLCIVSVFVLAIVFNSDYGVPYKEGGSDELHYEEKGLEFAQRFGPTDYGHIRGELVAEWHNSVFYVYLVGLMAILGEMFGGFNTFIPRIFNATCLALTSVIVCVAATRLGLKRFTAAAVGIAVGCLPLMAWVASQTLRDTIVTLILTLLVFLWIPDKSGKWQFSLSTLLAGSLLILLLMWELRKGQAFVSILFIGFALFQNRRSLSSTNVLFILVPMVMLVGYLLFQNIDSVAAEIAFKYEQAQTYTELRASAASGSGLSGIVFQTPLVPLGWLLRVVYALVSPLPVSYGSVDYAWLSIGTIIHIVFLPFFVKGMNLAFTERSWRYVVVMFLMLFLGMSMFTFTFRHIVQYMPMAVLIAALGYERYPRNRKNAILRMVGLGVTLGVFYVVLKIII